MSSAACFPFRVFFSFLFFFFTMKRIAGLMNPAPIRLVPSPGAVKWNYVFYVTVHILFSWSYNSVLKPRAPLVLTETTVIKPLAFMPIYSASNIQVVDIYTVGVLIFSKSVLCVHYCASICLCVHVGLKITLTQSKSLLPEFGSNLNLSAWTIMFYLV